MKPSGRTSSFRRSSMMDENPLGSWQDLKHSTSRQIKVLMKKQFLMKGRSVASMVEIFVGFILVLINYVIYALSKQDYTADQTPAITPMTALTSPLVPFFLAYQDCHVVCIPDNQKMRDLISHTDLILKAVTGGTFTYPEFGGASLTFPKASLDYTNDFSRLEDIIYQSDSNGVGFHWVNSEDADAMTNPIFKVYHQTTTDSPEQAFFLELRNAVIRYKYVGDPTSLANSISLNTQLSETPFAHPKLRVRITQVSMAVGFFSALTAIICSMPDMETLLEEKDSHVSALSFLMGMKESAYWFTNFISPFIIGVVSYLFTALIFCFWFGLKGSNFFLVFIFCILYDAAQLWFQFFISTFMKKGSSGRTLTIIMMILALFFSYLHGFLTLSGNTDSLALTHVCCILPFSCYELFIMQGWMTSVVNVAPYKWNDLNGSSYLCPPWIPLMWIIIDLVLYFGLFLIFNATNERGFGTPIIKWREIFDKNAWRRVFAKRSSDKISQRSDEFMNVKGLTKVYEGSKRVVALDQVEFQIKTGEVIVMIGPNGAGKSTLINAIAGVVEPTDGVIRLLGGEETKRFKEVQNYLGVCFQDNVIIRELSVLEHFELFGGLRGVPEEILQRTIDYFAVNMQLTEMLNNRAGDLSGGQKRKLCIGLALLGNPPVVLMDEPTAGVDVQARQLIWKMISTLKDTTSIVTSHALEEAEAVSSRLFIVAGGKMPFCGTSTELRNKYKCGYLLRVEREDGTAGPVLELAQSYNPDARLDSDRPDSIQLPVDASIPKFLKALTEKQEEYGVISYSFAVEQLEDMLLKLIQSEEVNVQN